MADNAIDKARAAKAAADAKLAELEAVEAQRAAEAEAKRLAARKVLAAKFLDDLPELQERVQGETVTPQQKGDTAGRNPRCPGS
ncbi:hypothetical protein [Streptomyces parvus]|uniref:hypothetical protein n=1 Tax=Streptomyces parvus TaxID=66428 RepID=UPI003638F534